MPQKFISPQKSSEREQDMLSPKFNEVLSSYALSTKNSHNTLKINNQVNQQIL